MRNSLDDGLFHVIFVTTPHRLASPKFKTYFEKAQIDALSLKHVLKRREPKQLVDEHGIVSMGWGPSCSEEDFAQAARALACQAASPWINVEGILSDRDKTLISSLPSLGVVVSGHELDAVAALAILGQIPHSNPVMLALENETMLLAGPEILAGRRLDGLVIGTSYLSESSKMYDQMGLDKYRSLMRGVAKRAASVGVRPYTTSNYCTFEATGMGDKNKDFVADQVGYVSKHGSWGAITRVYAHLDVAQSARMAMRDKTDRQGDMAW